SSSGEILNGSSFLSWDARATARARSRLSRVRLKRVRFMGTSGSVGEARSLRLRRGEDLAEIILALLGARDADADLGVVLLQDRLARAGGLHPGAHDGRGVVDVVRADVLAHRLKRIVHVPEPA